MRCAGDEGSNWVAPAGTNGFGKRQEPLVPVAKLRTMPSLGIFGIVSSILFLQTR